ncbi:hypothetical protein FQA39_LY07541 [Lamprigera yunnana]|nr:hypothetical protein FQA39_LY07541 [Lamprigera yunnana]
MAWLEEDARDIPPDYNKQVFHPNRDLKTVTCLLCDSGYCKSEFAKKVSEDVLIDQRIDDDDDALSVISDRSKKRKYQHDDPNKECADCIDYIQELIYEKRMNTELTKQNDELRSHNRHLRLFVSENNLQPVNTFVNAVLKVPSFWVT